MITLERESVLAGQLVRAGAKPFEAMRLTKVASTVSSASPYIDPEFVERLERLLLDAPLRDRVAEVIPLHRRRTAQMPHLVLTRRPRRRVRALVGLSVAASIAAGLTLGAVRAFHVGAVNRPSGGVALAPDHQGVIDGRAPAAAAHTLTAVAAVGHAARAINTQSSLRQSGRTALPAARSDQQGAQAKTGPGCAMGSSAGVGGGLVPMPYCHDLTTTP